MSIVEPEHKRAIAFVDGQNLFYGAKEAFGHAFPNVDPQALARAICAKEGWELVATHFYTGVPAEKDDPDWNAFWSAKLGMMKNWGIVTFSRPLRYRKQTVHRHDGTSEVIEVGQEKGVDIRIALDVLRLAYDGAFDVALIFSQDQDLSEVAVELRLLAQRQDRWLKVVSAFPVGTRTKNRRGINDTDWIQIDHATFDAAIDSNDYRPPERVGGTRVRPAAAKPKAPKPKPQAASPTPQAPKPKPGPKPQAPSRKPQAAGPKPQAAKLETRNPKLETAPLKKHRHRGRRGGKRAQARRAKQATTAVVPSPTTPIQKPTVPPPAGRVVKRPPQRQIQDLLLGGVAHVRPRRRR